MATYEKKYATASEARKRGLSSTGHAAGKTLSKIVSAQARTVAASKGKTVPIQEYKPTSKSRLVSMKQYDSKEAAKSAKKARAAFDKIKSDQKKAAHKAAKKLSKRYSGMSK